MKINDVETLSRTELEIYLDKLIRAFSLPPPVSDRALRILHNHKLYIECVREFKRIMNIRASINLKMYPDKLWSHQELGGRIIYPDFIPFIASPQYEKTIFRIEICESNLRDYFRFVIVIGHELAHLILHSLRHELKESEIATDLCFLVFGFGDIVVEAYRDSDPKLAYLNAEQFVWAQDYLARKRPGHKR